MSSHHADRQRQLTGLTVEPHIDHEVGRRLLFDKPVLIPLEGNRYGGDEDDEEADIDDEDDGNDVD